MNNSQKQADMFSLLKIPHVTEILHHLLHERRRFGFFSEMYGRNRITYTLTTLANAGMIKKIYDVTKNAVGYEITEHGRWTYHAYISFKRQLILQDSAN